LISIGFDAAVGAALGAGRVCWSRIIDNDTDTDIVIDTDIG
jgi:hypothetical protein